MAQADKAGLAQALRECALLMELAGENPFHCRAYDQAARILEGLEGQPTDWLAGDRLTQTKGIGKGMAEKVAEWTATGRLAQLEEYRSRIPAGLLELLAIPGLGPKKIKAVWDKLGIDSLAKLEAAVHSGEVAAL
ncbi:MAG: helix-hairpin-helix domain-containing protein, partial [bacterium]|nr:helix-hairpin-helix domain-containing protein [bacterium]